METTAIAIAADHGVLDPDTVETIAATAVEAVEYLPTGWRVGSHITSEALAASINKRFGELQNLGERAQYLRIVVGRELIEARALVEPGKWGDWCKANIRRSLRDIRQVMQMASALEPDEALAAERARAKIGMRKRRADERAQRSNVTPVAPVAEAVAPVELATGAGDLPTLSAGEELRVFETEAKNLWPYCIIRESEKHPGYFDIFGVHNSDTFETRPAKPVAWRAIQDFIGYGSEHVLTPHRWRWQIEPAGLFQRVRDTFDDVMAESVEPVAAEVSAAPKSVLELIKETDAEDAPPAAEPPPVETEDAEPKSVGLLRQALLAYADEVEAETSDPDYDDVYGYDGDGVARAREAASSPHIDERTLHDIVGEIIRQKPIKQGHANAAAKREAREARQESRVAPPADYQGEWRSDAV